MTFRVELDRREVDTFLERLRQLIGLARKYTEQEMSGLAHQAYDSIVDKTPVLTGEAINAWKLQRIGKYSWAISNKVDYVVYLEYGTVPHIIKAKDASVLRWVNYSTGEVVFSTIVHHPGTRPYGMVRSTITELRKQMPDFVANLSSEIFGEE